MAKKKSKKREKWPKGHPRKHSKAAKKGWSKKKRLLAHQKKTRGAHAIKVDRTKKAKHTFSARNKAGVKKWKKAPHKYDIKGVDTTKFTLKLIAKRIKPIYKKGKALVTKRLVAGNGKEKVVRKARIPKKEKVKRINGIRAKTVKDIKHITRVVKTKAREVAAKVVRAVKRKKWSMERKRQARIVARNTDATVMEADKLIQRARSKGWTYEDVNWDALQGKDLSYEGRVRRLQKQVGRTTTARDETREIKAMMDEFEHQYQRHVEREARRQGYGKAV